MTIPWASRFFIWIIGGRAGARIAADYIRAFDGCRILDLGCGPGRLPAMLPESIGEYYGVDANPAYIAAARARWKDRLTATFVCEDLAGAVAPKRGYYDIVTAMSIVHHLDDATARQLFSAAYEALAPGGRLVTWDCCSSSVRIAWRDGSSTGIVAGRFAPGRYRSLAADNCDRVETDILHDALRVPYTICAMTCTKSLAAVR